MSEIDVVISEDILDVEIGDMGLLLHNTLSGIQGGSAVLDERYHLTAAELANFNILVGGGDTALHYHSADRDRANHTGTQLLATIADAGTMAAQDADSVNISGGVITGLTGTLQINVPTATSEALILKSTDDDATKNVFEVHDSGGSAKFFVTPSASVASQFSVDLSNSNLTLIGIGTATPAYAIDVQLPLSPQIRITDTTNDVAVRMLADNTQGVFGTVSAHPLIIQTAGSGTAITIGTDSSVLIAGQAASVVPLIVQAAASQTANLQEWQNSSGAVLSGVDERGIPFADGGTDPFNTFFGASSGNTTMTGNQNTGIGNTAFKQNTTGGLNTAVGYAALRESLTGANNVAVGYGALLNKTSGIGNVGIGFFALADNISGTKNIALGSEAGRNETGSNTLYIANSNTTTPLIYGLFTGTGAGLTIHSQAVDGVPLIVKGIASQSSNLQEWQNSSSATQLAVASNGSDFILNTVTGTMWGTAASQKQAFWGATPIVRPTGVGVDAASIHAALVSIGLIAA